MRLTLPGHREGARVPPGYVDKCWSPLNSEVLRDRSYTPHAPKKLSLSGLCPVCMQDRCPHPAVWSQFGPCRAYLPPFHLSRQFCVESGPRIRCSAQCTILLLHFCTVTLATCCSARARGTDFWSITCSQASFFCSYIQQFSSLLIILTESWDGPRYLAQGLEGVVSVSLLSSLLLMKPRQHLPSTAGAEREIWPHRWCPGRSKGVCILTTAFFCWALGLCTWRGAGEMFWLGSCCPGVGLTRYIYMCTSKPKTSNSLLNTLR